MRYPELAWMPDALSGYGCKVQLVPGYQDRGHGPVSNITGVLGHHTADGPSGNYPSLRVVRDGRSDLPGPLCNLGLARDGTWLVVAFGLAYHAGTGSLPFAPNSTGNYHLIGVEAESTGYGDWTPEQLEAYPLGVAALLDHLNYDVSRFAFHKTYAPGRKIDAAGWPGDLNGFRRQIQQFLDSKGEDAMPTAKDIAKAVCDEQDRRHPNANREDIAAQVLNQVVEGQFGGETVKAPLGTWLTRGMDRVRGIYDATGAKGVKPQ